MNAAQEMKLLSGGKTCQGVLSSKDNAFGCFLGALAGEDCELIPPGKKWTNAGCVFGPKRAVAWRVLDAQYFGVAQRRRRVFVVASAREGFDPAAVLFECEGVRRDSAPSREAGKAVAALTANGVGTCGADDNQGQAGHLIPAAGFRMVAFGEYTNDGTASTMKARDYKDATDLAVMAVHGTQDPDTNIELAHTLGRNHGQENAVAYSVSLRGREGGATAEVGGEVAGCLRASSGGGDKPHVLTQCVTGDITHTLKAEGFDASEDGTGRGQPIVPVAFSSKDYGGDATENMSPTLRACGHTNSHANAGAPPAVATAMSVRRLTPVECERLQGFPDNWTNVPIYGKERVSSGELKERRAKLAADGPRYKAIGNSMAVPVMRWIGGRIIEELSKCS